MCAFYRRYSAPVTSGVEIVCALDEVCGLRRRWFVGSRLHDRHAACLHRIACVLVEVFDLPGEDAAWI
jgi:hypothetical protein